MADPISPQTNLYGIFHLNLAFSSLPENERARVIQRCYWPLLELIESTGIPLGIELTAYTLECIEKADRTWVDKFASLLSDGNCELLASGDSQIIGPLVPVALNRKNMRLGMASYEAKLGVRPNIAYVNEQACSSGLLDVYLECGLNTVVIEWNNPFSFHPDWRAEDFNQPRCLTTAQGNTINVIWNNAIAFQKFQRFAHGELILEDYMAWLDQATANGCETFCIYGNDAEIFDFRPGRYSTELPNSNMEWQRINTLLTALKHDRRYQWRPPHQTLNYQRREPALKLNIASHPITVKKQLKYNVTRWGLSGRNDLLLNTLCYRELDRLMQASNPDDNHWRRLCRLWSSDLRTHLCDDRYREINNTLQQAPPKQAIPSIPTVSACTPPGVRFDEARNKLHVRTEFIAASFNINRGLSIESLAFQQHDFKPVLGTLSHGHFDHISYGADFYSNHLVMERFRQRDRVTDLSPAQIQISEQDGQLLIRADVKTGFASLAKWYRFNGDSLETGFAFANQSRPEASLRLGFITLLDCDRRAWFACHNGGSTWEVFRPLEDFDHGAPVSSIVSATNALGATEGELRFGTENAAVRIHWNPAECAALPMLSSQQIGATFLNRLWFSLIESDETLQADGTLLPFSFTLSPASLSQVEAGE